MTFIPKQFLSKKTIYALVVRKDNNGRFNLAIFKHDTKEMQKVRDDGEAESYVLNLEYSTQDTLNVDELENTWRSQKPNWYIRLLTNLRLFDEVPMPEHPRLKIIRAAKNVRTQTRRGSANVLIYHPSNINFVANVLDGKLPGELGFTETIESHSCPIDRIVLLYKGMIAFDSPFILTSERNQLYLYEVQGGDSASTALEYGAVIHIDHPARKIHR